MRKKTHPFRAYDIADDQVNHHQFDDSLSPTLTLHSLHPHVTQCPSNSCASLCQSETSNLNLQRFRILNFCEVVVCHLSSIVQGHEDIGQTVCVHVSDGGPPHVPRKIRHFGSHIVPVIRRFRAGLQEEDAWHVGYGRI